MKASLSALAFAVVLLLAAGCELITQTDHTSLTVTDGTVSSFQTRQGNVVITAPARTNGTVLLP